MTQRNELLNRTALDWVLLLWATLCIIVGINAHSIFVISFNLFVAGLLIGQWSLAGIINRQRVFIDKTLRVAEKILEQNKELTTVNYFLSKKEKGGKIK